MTGHSSAEATPQSVLIVDREIISRHVIGVYLRHCGYAVVEAVNIDEAYVALGEATLSIDVILCVVSTLEAQSGFELSQWVRINRPELEVKLVEGVEMAAQTAAELCQSGPHLKTPYQPEAVVDYIKRLRAGRLT